MTTLEQAAEEGFDPEAVEALLHQMELQQKHQGRHFGLHMSTAIMSVWNHDGWF